MRIDRSEDGDEDPSQKPEADLPKDTGRSEEVPTPEDVGRPGDAAPDNSSGESQGIEDAGIRRAESRTRSEYADHVTPPGSTPIEGDPPKQAAEDPGQLDDDHLEGTALEEERSDGSSAEQRQSEGRLRVANGLEGSDEQSTSFDDPPAEPAHDDAHNAKPAPAPDPTRGLASETDVLEAYNTHETEDERLGDALNHEDTTQDNDQPHPLTNKEWAEHLDEVRDDLDNARKAGLRTNLLYTIDGKGQIWSEERDLLHDSMIEDFYAKAADVPCNFKAIMAGGLGGAGKTTVLTEHAGIDLTKYLMINPDNFKEEMARRGMLPEVEGLSPMEASDLAHEESSYLAKRLARRAEAEGKNLIWDITMASQDSTEDRITNLREAGYTQVDGIFVDISIEISVKRTDSRHREGHENYRSGVGLGGRFVSPEVIRSQSDKEWSSQNRRTYEAVKEDFSSWTVYDNSVDDRPAVLIDSSNRRRGS